jgi:hypothetical protein
MVRLTIAWILCHDFAPAHDVSVRLRLLKLAPLCAAVRAVCQQQTGGAMHSQRSAVTKHHVARSCSQSYG